MPPYICPICHKEIQRDLTIFLEHGDDHIVEAIQKRHPEWKADDGTCPKCLEHYKKSMGKS